MFGPRAITRVTLSWCVAALWLLSFTFNYGEAGSQAGTRQAGCEARWLGDWVALAGWLIRSMRGRSGLARGWLAWRTGKLAGWLGGCTTGRVYWHSVQVERLPPGLTSPPAG